MRTLDRLIKDGTIEYKNGISYDRIRKMLDDNDFNCTYYDGKHFDSLQCFERGKSRIDVTLDFKQVGNDSFIADRVNLLEYYRG